MIEQQGRVERIEGAHAWVRVGARSDCAACAAGRGCGAGLFARLLRRRSMSVKIPSSGGVRAGDPVLLGIPESAYLSLVLRLYGLPLVAGLAGAGAGHLAGNALAAATPVHDLAALSGGLLVAILAFRFGTARDLQGLCPEIEVLEVKRESD